jgi:hypothetical protein
LHTYNDPSGVLQLSDIENIAFMGFWKAINKYDYNKWDNAIGWCYHVIRQQILREINKIYKRDKTFINSYMNPNLFIEELSDSLELDEMIVDTTICYIKDIQKLCIKLECANIKANLMFQLKLVFPDLTRNSIAKILGFKKRNGLAKVVRTIRAVSYFNLDQELVNDDSI